MPLVIMPNIPFAHIQLEWQAAEYREWNEHIVQRRRLIRYDSRGQGLSDRDVTEYSLDAYLLDLEAVGGRLGLESFSLFSPLFFPPGGLSASSSGRPAGGGGRPAGGWPDSPAGPAPPPGGGGGAARAPE